MSVPDLRSNLGKLLKAMPAAAPFGAGAVWSNYWSQISVEEVRQLLAKAELSREEMRALLAQQPDGIRASVQEIADERERLFLVALFEQRKDLELILDRLNVVHPALKDLVAVIPAGGPGAGLWPLTSVQPKALVPIRTKPLLIHILESLDPTYFAKAIVTADDWFDMINCSCVKRRRARGLPGRLERLHRPAVVGRPRR